MKRRGTHNAPPCKQRPPPLAGYRFTAFAADRRAFLPLWLCVQLTLTRSGRVAESGQAPNPGVRSRIVVGVASVVDNARVSGRCPVHGAKPPIGTINKAQRPCIVAYRTRTFFLFALSSLISSSIMAVTSPNAEGRTFPVTSIRHFMSSWSMRQSAMASV